MISTEENDQILAEENAKDIIENNEENNATEDFRSIFKPIYYINSLYFAKKFSMKNNTIQPSSFINVVGSLILNVMLVILCYLTCLEFLTILKSNIVIFVYYVVYAQYVVQFLTLTYIQYQMREGNYKLIKGLSETYYFLYDKKDVHKIRMFLLVPYLIYGTLLTCLIVLKLSLDPLWSWHRGIFIMSTIIFDLEIIYASFVVYFLSYNIKKWTEKVKKLNINMIKDVMEIFLKIVDCIRLVEKISQSMITFYFVTCFTQTLGYIEIAILWAKNQTVETNVVDSHIMGAIVWIIKDHIAQISVCICCEILYWRMEKAITVIEMRLKDDHKQTKIFAKNILRIYNNGLKKITACGMFNIDAAMPLKIVEVVSAYTIVLLQFAYL